MARRKAYTKVIKENQIREDHVKGMGDVVFKGFQCINPKCTQFLFVRTDEITDAFNIECPTCSFNMKSGEETKFYDYELFHKVEKKVIEKGEFSILHDDYLNEAQDYKYCIICNTIKPLHLFDKHSSRKSRRQGECRLCKGVYNSIKNQTRITDQHREAAQKRRLYIDLAGGQKIDSKKILDRFNHKCFKCGKDLSEVEKPSERPLDHTLPAYYLWPLTTENATLLCQKHNGEKSGKWPSEYYEEKKLKKLSVITGIDYQILSGEPQYNPEAIEQLKNEKHVDKLLTKFSAYIEEIIKLRNRLKHDIDFDFFEHSKMISAVHVQKADEIYEGTYGKRPSS
jgi:endogenous inhibitor of DNA gyrase (YacG/DUF329 family)